MAMTSIGDMALQHMLRLHNVQLNQKMNSLVQTLASGQVEDTANPVTGDYRVLGDIDRSLRLLEGYDVSVAEAAVFTETAQNALGAVQDRGAQLSSDLIVAAQTGAGVGISSGSQAALQDFDAMVETLNISISGRSVFAGYDTTNSALADGADILDEVRSSVSGLASGSEIADAILAWFTEPDGGFETSGYTGGDGTLAPFQLNQDESVGFDVTANAPQLRRVLAHTAIAALASDEGLGLDAESKRQMMQDAGEMLSSELDGVTELRADIGGVQERIDQAKAQNSNFRAGLELSRSGLVSADPYETATQLQETQTQLETLYLVTGRLSNLTLANYIG